jgi:hypothetical protein
MTSPQSFGGIDPCPGVRKYAEIAFKCRPSKQFFSLKLMLFSRLTLIQWWVYMTVFYFILRYFLQ